jgi:hypothetical protein
MLVLRKRLLDFETEWNSFFIHLNFDTHPSGYFSAIWRFSNGEFSNSEPWIGKVSIAKKKFEISRTGVGTFKQNVSSIVIRGEEVIQGNRKMLKLRFGVSSGYLILSLFSLIFLSILMVTLFQDVWGLAMMLCIVVLNVLLTILELNKSEGYMTDYLNSIKELE